MAEPAQLDYHAMGDKSQTDTILQLPLSSPTAKRSLESEVPVETTAIGFGNRCGKPRGPREPPSEWT